MSTSPLPHTTFSLATSEYIAADTRCRPVEHVVVGPDEHGVTEYALRLIRALEDPLENPLENQGTTTQVPVHRFATWQQLRHHVDHRGPLSEDNNRSAEHAPALHITFTDHLFGPDPNSAVDLVCDLATGRPLSVSVHDVPQPEEGQARYERRAAAYARLAARADLLWVNSEHEARFFRSVGSHTIDPQVVPLPLPATLTAPTDHNQVAKGSVVASTIGVMGFIYPGKGHAELIDALTGTGYQITALGALATGHSDLGEELHQRAGAGGLQLEITGYLPEADLERAMRAIDIPVCPHRHFSASGSLMKWIALGRKVLVADSDYSRELATRWPEFIITVPDDEWADALAKLPEDFTAPLAPPTDWTWDDVAHTYEYQWLWRLGGRAKAVPALTPTATAPATAPATAVVTATAPAVSVIVPYYNNPDDLQQLLAALNAQDYPGQVECIIADDGSDEPPVIPTGADAPSFPVRIVRQADHGFRAAAARNLGAAGARGEILVFLDGDTIPRPSYLSHATAATAVDPRVVTVGTRVHGDGAEPSWLADAWARTHNLHAHDDSLWRFVISAVLTCSAEMFRRAGGFDGSMVGYGGEDWDFGWRCWNAGALFHHAASAVADHPDDDWGGRAESLAQACAEKNAESIALARRVSHPMARPDAVIFTVPDVLVIVPPQAPWTWPVGACESVIAGWLALPDVHVACPGTPALVDLFSADPRVHFLGSSPLSSDATTHPLPADTLGDWKAARFRVRLAGPVVPTGLEDVRAVDNLGGHVRIIAPGSSALLAVVDSARYRTRRGGAAPWVAWPERWFSAVSGLTVDATAAEEWTTVTEPQRLERHFAGW